MKGTNGDVTEAAQDTSRLVRTLVVKPSLQQLFDAILNTTLLRQYRLKSRRSFHGVGVDACLPREEFYMSYCVGRSLLCTMRRGLSIPGPGDSLEGGFPRTG